MSIYEGSPHLCMGSTPQRPEAQPPRRIVILDGGHPQLSIQVWPGQLMGSRVELYGTALRCCSEDRLGSVQEDEPVA